MTVSERFHDVSASIRIATASRLEARRIGSRGARDETGNRPARASTRCRSNRRVAVHNAFSSAWVRQATTGTQRKPDLA
jgi:hypothetical protein